MIPIQPTLDLQPLAVRGSGDKIDHDFMADQRSPTPILADRREQPVLDLVPIAGPWVKMANGDLQPGFIGKCL